MVALGLILAAFGLQTKPFLIGAEWREDAPPAVKQLFWETGCNFTRLTGGGYGWVVDAHKRALKELEAHGVRVLLQLGSHYPDGKYFDMKDAYFIDQNGKTGVPSRQSWAVEYDGSAWPQYSYASERFKSGLEGDFTAYFKSLGRLEDVEAIMVHNEPGYHWLDKRIFDYNPSTVERFRAWLPSQYASIGALNKAWGSSFSSFASVEPPHDFPSLPNLTPWIDWRKSNVEVIGDFLDWERTFSRRINPTLPVTTNLSGPIDNWYPFRLGDNYRFTQNMDIASIDIYPGSEWTTRFLAGYAMDMTQGAAGGKPVYVAECESYAPEHFSQLSDEQRAARLACDLWTYIGHGANGVLIWTLNGQDGFRLTNGEFNARLRTVRDIAYSSKMLDLRAFRRTPRRVAVVIDSSSYLLVGPKEDSRAWAGRMARTAQGLYGALIQAHIETDVITTDMLRNGLAKRYRALVLACVETMDAKLASTIDRFVEDGGLVISDGSLASFDRSGKELTSHPGFGLNAVFGSKGPHAFGKGKTALVDANLVSADSDGSHPEVGTEIGRWLKAYAGVSPEVDFMHADENMDASRLVDAKGNELAVVTCPQNKAEPEAPNRKVTVRLPKQTGKSQYFLVFPSTNRQGPVRIAGSTLDIANLESHAVILTARDHTPLINTNASRVWPARSHVSIGVTVYNPSPRPLHGNLEVVAPDGWSGGKTAPINLGPYGEASVTLTATSGLPTKRAVLKTMLITRSSQVESIPFDVEIR